MIPYLNRKLLVLQRTGELPRIPKDLVNPTIVAGINALGRGQDRESLTQFITTIAQTIGPEAMMSLLNADEVVKRLAAAQGIDVLNLVKSMDQQNAEQQQQQQAAAQHSLVDQAGQFINSPMAAPPKNEDAPEIVEDVTNEITEADET